MRIRRLHKRPAALEITAFLNLIVVLVPFLLSTAVFSRLAILQLTLPAQSADLSGLKEDKLKLEVVIRPDAIEVGDQNGGLIQRIANMPTGPADLATLSDLMTRIKEKFPAKTDAAVLAEPNTSYDALVQVMDAVRVGRQVQGKTVVRAELFPDISIGDAPVRAHREGT
jgi:biopolymer transport protein ExbD